MNDSSWWTADEDKVHERVIEYVTGVEQRQFDLFDKFAKLAALYDPNEPGSRGLVSMPSGDKLSMVTENVIASNVDTVAAVISATEIRARFQTDGADWSTQRRAKHLEWYAEGLSTLLDVDEKCREAFRDAALKGTGVLKVYVDDGDEICVERVLIDDIVVDELECRTGATRQMHQRRSVDREALHAEFPQFEREIEAAQVTGGRNWRLWAGYRPIESHEIVVLESWRLPIGKPDSKRYVAGRHSIVIDGCTLLDEEWTEQGFPFVVIRWTKRPSGWYGLGLAERIAGIQRALNKRNWQIDRQLDQGAVPTTYVRIADANMAVKTTNRAGSIAVYKSDVPKTVVPIAVSGETYQSRVDLKNAAFEESGVSRMTAQASKPGGLDSGVALREYRDQTTQRFSLQEKAFERLKLDTVLAMIACAKSLGKNAPVVVRAKWGQRKIAWSQVDMGETKVSIAAASTLARSPAGRMQTVLEWAQAGVISMDESRRLLDHPDLERSMSIYTAGLENIEEMFEQIEDGEILMPSPYQNLKMLVWRGQMELMRIDGNGAPEEILEAMRQCIVQAAYILSGGAAAGADPAAIPASSGDMTAAAEPMAGPATAALAPQAMQLRAS
jgi:hypothetical protein